MLFHGLDGPTEVDPDKSPEVQQGSCLSGWIPPPPGAQSGASYCSGHFNPCTCVIGLQLSRCTNTFHRLVPTGLCFWGSQVEIKRPIRFKNHSRLWVKGYGFNQTDLMSELRTDGISTDGFSVRVSLQTASAHSCTENNGDRNVFVQWRSLHRDRCWGMQTCRYMATILNGCVLLVLKSKV